MFEDMPLMNRDSPGNSRLGFCDEVELEGTKGHLFIIHYHRKAKGGQLAKFLDVRVTSDKFLFVE